MVVETAGSVRRDERLDAIRGLGMVFIIIGHSVSVESWARSFIFSFHVPLFYFVSGYLFSVKPGKLKKTLLRSGKPYIFTSLIIIILYTIKASVQSGAFSRETLKKWILAALYMSGSRKDFLSYSITPIGAMWFLAALVWASLFLYIILKYIPDSRLGKVLRTAAVVILFFAGFLTAKITWLPFSIQAGACALLFMYAGYCLKDLMWKRPKFPTAFLICLIIWLIDILAGKGNQLSMVSCKFPHLILNVAGALAAVYAIFRFTDRTINIPVIRKIYQYLAWLGKSSMIILCFHTLEMKFMPWDTLLSFLPSFMPYFLIKMVLKLLWATFWVFIINRIKPLKWIFS